MAAFIALQCISPTGGLATITRRRAARRRSISAADELWVDFPGAYGAGINGRLECSARVSREPERGPVERVRLLGEARALRPAQCLRRPVRGERVVEPAYQDEGGAIVHLPERRDDGGSACVKERALQPDQLVATRELAQARLARREHDQARVQVHAEELTDLEAAVLAVARHQQERGGERVLLVEHGVGGEVQHAGGRAERLRLVLGGLPAHVDARAGQRVRHRPHLTLGEAQRELRPELRVARAPPPARSRPCPCWAGTSVRWRSARWTGASP